MQQAKAQQLPMLSRAQLLGQIMDNYEKSIAVAGTHGKTTTTSMISEILLCRQSRPNYLRWWYSSMRSAEISVWELLPSLCQKRANIPTAF